MPLVLVTGPAGVGKSAVGSALAARLDVPFADADDFHPPANVAKMRAGTPLTEDDRRGWLAALARWLGERDEAVLACSALRRTHRDTLRGGRAGVLIVALTAPPDVLQARVSGRPGHFMPPSLVPDQVATLEPLAEDEPGFPVDASLPLDEVVALILDRVRRW